MKTIWRTTAFKIGFSIGVCLFVLGNGFGYPAIYCVQIMHALDNQTLVYFEAYGIPFVFSLVMSDASRLASKVFWVELIADVLIGLACSLLIGLVIAWFYSKIKTQIGDRFSTK